MKIRTDHVTNSSSSNFILSFKDDKDFKDFKTYCGWLDYNEFLNLIENLIEDKENINKENALDFLRTVYSREFKFEVLDVKFKDYWKSNDIWKKRKEYEESDEFKSLVEDHLSNNEEYQEKRKQIEEANFVVKGTVWDTSGGLLEWAIRNGFIEDNFYRHCVIRYNVG